MLSHSLNLLGTRVSIWQVWSEIKIANLMVWGYQKSQSDCNLIGSSRQKSSLDWGI